MLKTCDYLIIGAGIFGCYAADLLNKKYPNKKIILLEYDEDIFQRASYINQARVHNGYHYPRSLYTALKSAQYYERFARDFAFSINKSFRKIYAISNHFSLCNKNSFIKFCQAANIKCNEIHPGEYFNPNMIEAAFATDEFSMDAKLIRAYYKEKFGTYNNLELIYKTQIQSTEQKGQRYCIKLKNEDLIETDYVINTSYASINQINNKFGLEPFRIKYEIAELILCSVSKDIQDQGITVMDGAFFSVMPFGLSGVHSLTAVHHTPHKSSKHEDKLPHFSCQNLNTNCSSTQLENCNNCPVKPETAWEEMLQLSQKYLLDRTKIQYQNSLFAMKAILEDSELSDSRPTIIKRLKENPCFISVLSGKFNTIYDLEEVL